MDVAATTDAHPGPGSRDHHPAEPELGPELGVLFRAHLRLAQASTGGLPGGPRGYQVLVEAARGVHANQVELARHLGVDRTVMTYLLDELEDAGLVRRRPDPADRRARQVAITDAGWERARSIGCGLHAAEEQLLGALEPAERAVLRDMLHRLAEHLGTGVNPCRVVQEIAELDPASS